MKALRWQAPFQVGIADDVAMPRVEQPRDAVLRVIRSALCGTDLHPYRGEIPQFTPGTVTGHEFTGVVEDVGSEVRAIRPGDRVVASDVIACGRCWYCDRGWHYQCDHVGLFGYDTVVGKRAFPGGHAEYVRVPFADVVLYRIPENISDEQALFVGDILSTGYACALGGGIRPGDTVAIVGCGPVGLMALEVARILGAAQIMAIDPAENRLALAARRGAQPVLPDDEVDADVVLEAVGTDAALLSALKIVRPRGTICAVGAHASDASAIPTWLAFGKEITMRFSVGDPISAREPLFNLIRHGRLDPTFVISHRLPLAEGTEAFRLFDSGRASKVVLIP